MLKKITKLITNNFGLKVLAVLFSVALWLVVVNIDDPKTTRTFTTTVSVENGNYLTGIGKYYEIVNNTSTVTFKASGKRSYLERMSNSDFRAVADLEAIENMNRVPIDITPQRYTSNVSVTNKTYYLEVAVEDLRSESFVISVETVGEVGDQKALGSVSISPNILRVSGPSSVVEQVDKVVARVDVNNMTTDMIDSVIPLLYDAKGNEMNTSELSFNMQSVTASVQILDTKEVTINFQTSGTPPEGYEYIGIEYNPQTVRVKGQVAVLNTMNSITVPKEVLDLTDATEDIVKTVDVSSYLPEGVTLMDNEQAKIDVTVKLEKHETRKFKVPTANITVTNLSDEYSVEFLEDEVEIELGGLSTDLDELDPGTLTGSIDASGMTDGEHKLNLELNLDGRFALVRSATVTIDIIDVNSLVGGSTSSTNGGAGGNSSGGNNSNNTTSNTNQNQNTTGGSSADLADDEERQDGTKKND
ncbi:MAG: CdaR family protein [Roseburia sp.]|nr:CdaR family protein [Roseburia sp.]